MKKYIIAIEETTVDEFEIEAKDAEEAMHIAEERYQSGEIVLKPGEVQFRQMAIVKPDSEAVAWAEF